MIVKNEDVQAIIIKIRHSYIAVAIYCRKRWSTHQFFQWHDTCFASDAAHRIFSPFEVRRGEDLRRIARHFSFGRHFGCSIWGVVVLLGLLSGWTWYPYFCNKVQGDLWPLTFDLWPLSKMMMGWEDSSSIGIPSDAQKPFRRRLVFLSNIAVKFTGFSLKVGIQYN